MLPSQWPAPHHRIVKHGGIYVVEARWEGAWLPVGVYKHVGAAQALALSLVKAKEHPTVPELQPEIVWQE